MGHVTARVDGMEAHGATQIVRKHVPLLLKCFDMPLSFCSQLKDVVPSRMVFDH